MGSVHRSEVSIIKRKTAGRALFHSPYLTGGDL